MDICSKRDLKILTGTMAAAMLFSGCAKQPQQLKFDPDIKAEINLNEVKKTDYDKDLMDQEYRRYCMDILRETLKAEGSDANLMISPASLMMALDMAAAGAKGDTLAQLTDLFAAGQGPLTQQAFAADLMDKLNSSKKVDFSVANSAWSNSLRADYAVNADYIDYIKDTFLAEYNVRTFDDAGKEEINKWIDENTDHMIKEVIDELDPDAIMVLVNAIAFEGKWENGYDDDSVYGGEFLTASGDKQSATFLTGSEEVYFGTEKATGFMKYYEGEEYAFVAILPNDGSVSANEFAIDFTAEDYEAFVASAEYGEVIATMPEFTGDYKCEMKEVLKALGVTNAFDTPDFSGIAGIPGGLGITDVIHRTHIEVDAKGTKAAAASAVMMRDSVEQVQTVLCNRPFMYAIVDAETMDPIFIGTVNEV